ncbi:hypothetical protein [Oceanobacillus bengalensis]
MKKSYLRTWFACWILLCLIGSQFYIFIYHYTISLTFVIMFIGAVCLLASQQKLIYHLFSSFTVTIGYAALLYWEKVSPIWLVFPRILIISIIIGFIASSLASKYITRIAVCLFGVLSGEVVHGLTLDYIGLQETIGEWLFLDTLLSALLLLTFLDILQRGKTNLDLLLKNYKQNLRWQGK